MAALAWLLIPLFAAIGAGVWGVWAGRTRKTAGDGTELAGYARFVQAMEKAHTEVLEARSDVDVVATRATVLEVRSGVLEKSHSGV
ncbi:hypothetical protein OK074_9118 [Actinobacteria bacterium OK074]|nr:hypothetical protein OK074_9118 [Actinobacteria bacterium OK074]